MVSTGRLQRMRGFTLIEIAIVLVVIGLLLSGGLLAVAPVLERTKITDTNGKLDRIEDALILYAIQNTCLPCPADGALATGTGNYGQSLDSTGTPNAYTSGCADQSTFSGNCRAAGGDNVVPWLSLGLSEADVSDAWGNRIYLAIDPAVDSAGGMQRSGTISDRNTRRVYCSHDFRCRHDPSRLYSVQFWPGPKRNLR